MRIWLTADDLARTRFGQKLSPLGTVVLSTQALRGAPPMYDPWRRRVRVDEAMRPLFDVVPATGHIPDYLTPVVSGGIEAELDALLSTPRRRIEARSWASRRLADGDRDTWRALTNAMRGYFDTAIAPHWAAMSANHHADTAHRTRLIGARGVERVFSTLHPDVRWSSPVLEIVGVPGEDVDLGGRGLILYPSAFMWSRPRLLVDPDGPGLLVYPARDAASAWRSPTDTDTLAALLGRTRATLLRAIAEGGDRSTGGLATRLAISPAAASQHAATLRAAGLIETGRAGRFVAHSLTPLGEDFLATNGVRPSPAPADERWPGRTR
ncbi:ArsR/SmtB family transcription factor [Actinokineospora sp. HUAS TT18]|uniref:ArsR/SmtB family transcription factor n=1 Tax=Actinokineospora sp. HUAS TT18 TaxID=3447451 RepID=UPI003F5260CE